MPATIKQKLSDDKHLSTSAEMWQLPKDLLRFNWRIPCATLLPLKICGILSSECKVSPEKFDVDGESKVEK